MVVPAAAARFLSTLPARGATTSGPRRRTWPRHFYPRSPRGERPTSPAPPPKSKSYFYPRSPRGERHDALPPREKRLTFLSTLPARGATEGRAQQHRANGISIHAPREGTDDNTNCVRW